MTGTIDYDIISIGETGNCFILNQEFVYGEQCSIPNFASGGVLGLGLEGTLEKTSFVSNLINKGVITQGLFSLYLDDVGFDGNSVGRIESNLIIGGYDLKAYSDDEKKDFNIHKTTGKSQGWTLNLLSICYNEQNFTGSNVLIDAGFPYISGPRSEIKAIYSQIYKFTTCKPLSETNILTCTCTDTSSLPPISFTIDDITYSIPSEAYQFMQNGNCQVFLLGQNETYWILGSIFLRKYYSVWSLTNSTIGFVPVKKSGKGGSDGTDFSKDWIIAVAVIVSLLVAGGAVAVSYMIYKKRSVRSDSVFSRDSFVSVDGSGLN